MSVYTTVTAAQLADFLKRYSIGALADLQGIAGGVENTNYFVTTTHGRYVLTLFERLGRAELPFYLHLMAHLSRHGIPCPSPIADRDNEYLGSVNGKPAVIVSCLPGSSLEASGLAECAQVGAMLADLHLAAESYGRRQDNPRGAAWREAAARQVRPWLDEADRALLAAELAFQRAHSDGGLPMGVIHADLFRDNVLFSEGRIGGILDFYFAGVDALAYDAAIAVNDWCVDAAGRPDEARAAALLGAYHAVRPFTAAEQAAWPRLLRAAALRFWLSRLLDLHQPRPGEMVLAKDPGWFRDLLRLRAAQPAALPV